jgi:phage shock protein PspC (stress-responsive transcriptional regulator)
MMRNMQCRVIAGVCSGLAEHFKIDPLIVRLIFVAGFLYFGVGPLAYAILWVCTQKKSS